MRLDFLIAAFLGLFCWGIYRGAAHFINRKFDVAARRSVIYQYENLPLLYLSQYHSVSLRFHGASGLA